MKECTKCGALKEMTEFYFRKDRQVYRSACSSCMFIAAREYRARPDKARCLKDAYYKKTYGIGIVDYERMLEEQGRCCAICHINVEHVKHQVLHIDHDHDSGAVRALLCGSCNRALGLMNDSSKFLTAAADYLKRFNK